MLQIENYNLYIQNYKYETKSPLATCLIDLWSWTAYKNTDDVYGFNDTLIYII